MGAAQERNAHLPESRQLRGGEARHIKFDRSDVADYGSHRRIILAQW